jgi:hypothetical protein
MRCLNPKRRQAWNVFTSFLEMSKVQSQEDDIERECVIIHDLNFKKANWYAR